MTGGFDNFVRGLNGQAVGAPRVGPAVVADRRKVHWSDAEESALRRYFPTGGLEEAELHLPERSRLAIIAYAAKLGIKFDGSARTKEIAILEDRARELLLGLARRIGAEPAWRLCYRIADEIVAERERR